MNITYNTRLKLHPIEVRKDQSNYIVEDKVTGEFYEMPRICIEAIMQINVGKHLDEIEKELKTQFPKEDVNLIEFTKHLLELDLIHEVDGTVIVMNQQKQNKLGFTAISPKVGRFFFNDMAKKGYATLFLLNLFIFILNPHLFPNFKDIFIYDAIFQNIIAWIIIGGILVLAHELGHVLAIRAHHLPTKLEVGHRLFFIVLETDLSLAWKLSPRKRTFLYLSGMCFDNVILFFALILQLIFPKGPEIILSIMGFIVIDIVMRLIYQCCVYMKTDLYYVLENITGCYNLMENAKSLLKKKNGEFTIYNGEKSIIYSFSLFYLLGIIISLSLVVFYLIPQFFYTLDKIIPGFKAPIGSSSFWDSIIVLVQIILFLSLLSFSFYKSYKNGYDKRLKRLE
ncbi:hypothetical protein ACFSO7_22325 [Bacillus sp. CGMCC 1.16607]|uniref:hypothetical protein n=1 Tax=Bacillus sp. CGMCC 1.16607 TaxID=3351842 RepID=UPI00362D0E57